jgi:CubicO group peptidase (beta-lactamase class C family)
VALGPPLPRGPLVRMRLASLSTVLLLGALPAALRAAPELPAVSAAMQATVDAHEIAGAVTLVAGKDGILHLGTTGLADIASKRPMRPDTMFWLASMTKPVTSVAILMLQDDGKLSVDDPVSKYLPEFAGLKTPSGKPANITIAQLLNHTSGLASPRRTEASRSAKTLRELAGIYLSSPMQFEPGSSWAYTTSGFVVLGLIVETVAAQPFDAFLQDRLFDPLGMKDTTFYPTDGQRLRLARAYRANPGTGVLTAQEGIWSGGPDPRRGECVPLGDGGLFSTAGDYARFCQMLLSGGTLEGRRYLSPAAFRALATVCTGDLPTGYSKRKLNHVLGWGLGVAIVRAPGDGVSAWLSQGSFGHPGAWGTAAWIDPVKGAVYVMMVQRPNMPDNFENPPALAFVRAAAGSLGGAPR